MWFGVFRLKIFRNMIQKVHPQTASIQDSVEIARIYNQYVGLPLATMDSIPWSAETVEAWMGSMEDREILLVLRSPRSGLHGWGAIKSYSPRAGYRTTGEISLYLDPEDRGRGLGDLLIQALIQQAREAGIHHVVSKTFASNLRSREFHETHGFELVGVQKEVGQIDGNWQDVAIYQLILS